MESERSSSDWNEVCEEDWDVAHSCSNSPSFDAPSTNRSDDFLEGFEDALVALLPKKKRVRKSYAPPRVFRQDVRRFYGNMWANVMNSHDELFTAKFVETYCIPTVKMTLQCTDMTQLRRSEVLPVTSLHIKDRDVLGTFLYLLQHYNPDFAVGIDEMTIATSVSRPTSVLRAVVNIKLTQIHELPAPLIAKQLLQSQQATSISTSPESRKRKRDESNELPLFPMHKEPVKLCWQAELSFDVDEHKYITKVELSAPFCIAFE